MFAAYNHLKMNYLATKCLITSVKVNWVTGSVMGMTERLLSGK